MSDIEKLQSYTYCMERLPERNNLLCSNRIPITESVCNDCKKAGRGSQLQKDRRRYTSTCDSRNPNGIQCGLPEGHFGRHQNGLPHGAWE